MALDTVTLLLSGEVSLEDFEKAVVHFNALVRALSQEVGGGNLNWLIHDLEAGSALVSARGSGATLSEVPNVERVVRAYGEVGIALEHNSPMRFSKSVQLPANKLKLVAREKIEFVRFETAESEATIRSNGSHRQVVPGLEIPLSSADMIRPAPASFGSVEGQVQTLSNRGGLRFSLYDLLRDKAVSCYLQEGHENIMRKAWGKVSDVYGWVTRDQITGRALTVRQVTRIDVRTQTPKDYRIARGCSPSRNGMSAEEAIRRVRNA